MFKYVVYLIAVVLLVVYIKYVWKNRNLYKCGFKLNGPFPWPIIGNSLWCLGNSEDILNKLAILFEKYRTPYRFWLGLKLVIAISKPQDLQIMLNSTKCIKKDDKLMYFFTPFLGNGLITAQPTLWKLHRKILYPAFNQNVINTFIPAFNENTMILIDILKKLIGRGSGSHLFDINKYISLNTLDFICDTAMGIKMNAQSKETIYPVALNRLLKCIYERIFHVWNHLDSIFYCTTKGKQFKSDLKIVHEFSMQVLKRKKIEYYEKTKLKTCVKCNNIPDSNCDTPQLSNKRKPLLEYMFEYNEKGICFTDQEIFDEINTFIAAGTDTISSVISFVCMMLGSNTEIQDRVFQEIKMIINENNSNEISIEDLSKMQYLERCINETMRLFPPVPLLIRTATDDVQLDTCIVPKNAVIAHINMYTHRDPNIWPNPLKFDPDRFLAEEKIKRHPYSFLPFGGGLRTCIGIRYAMIAMKVTLSLLITNFRFHSNYNIETIRIENNVVLRPVAGHLVQLELRSSEI